MEVIGNAKQRLAPCIRVRWVKVEELVLIGKALALDADAGRVVPVVFQPALPSLAPLHTGPLEIVDLGIEKRALCHIRRDILVVAEPLRILEGEAQCRCNRLPLAAAKHHGRATDEVQVRVVEVVGVEVMDDARNDPVAHVGVEPAIFEDSRHRCLRELVGVVLANTPAIVPYTVGMLVAPREQEHADVGQRVPREDDRVGRLLVFFTGLRVDVPEATREAIIPDDDAGNFRVIADIVIPCLQRNRKMVRDRA